MRYTLLIATLFSTFFIGCKSEQEKTTEALNKAVRTRFEDYAFKHNEKVTLLEISGLKYEMISENTLDTLKMISAMDKFDYYKELTNSYIKKTRDAQDLIDLARSAESYDLLESYKHEKEDHLEKAQMYNDSMKYFLAQDSTIRNRIKSNKQPKKNYYEAKFFCKATIGGNNLLDTLVMTFDKDYNYVDTKK